MEPDKILGIIRELASAPTEREWVEFKRNFVDEEAVGKLISAIANSATLHGKDRGCVVWGVVDGTHELVGTSFRPRATKVGNEDLEPWLTRHLRPDVHFAVHEVEDSGLRFVLIEIPAATHTPVRFKDFEYIRVGSYTKKLRDHSEKERRLWRLFEEQGFEEGVAAADMPPDDVLQSLDYPSYFELVDQPLPDRPAILERLVHERFIIPVAAGNYAITNLGAVLFAKELQEFGSLRRRPVRVIEYNGANRVETTREQEGRKGYASGFSGLIDYILSRLPTNEVIERSIRKVVPVYPPIAVRELVANALIHQDFGVRGAGTTVEVFVDRIEITNPGTPLIDTDRFLDAPPRSRNERLASFMRRIGVCEERGSGIDKVITYAELFQLPAPDFRSAEGSTCSVLFAPRPFSGMDRKDRIRACYQHAGLMYVSNKQMTNSSLRKRFAIEKRNAAQASRIIRDTLETGLIREYDPASRSPRDRRYVPFWA